MTEQEPPANGLDVTPSDWLHFHACSLCGHSWGCNSHSCLLIRGVVQRGDTTVSPKTRIADSCKRHKRT